MKIETAEDAIEAYTGQDAWKFADREAAWEWMFEAGRKSAMNTCYRLAMAASEPAKGGSFNDGKWAVADAIKELADGGCDCVSCTCLTHNALAQADAACGVSPGAMGSAAQLRRTE